MVSANTNVPFTMVRDDFADVPHYDLPSGYRSRMYRDGDQKTWIDIHRSAEPFIDITRELFDREFGAGIDVLPQRMFFIETDDGSPAGTITAWWENKQYKRDERGRIHWVVVHPYHQGRGIAKVMMTLAMGRLSNFHQQAMLGTSSGRPLAVKIYLDYGFRPDDAEKDNAEIVQAWRTLNNRLHHPTLDAYLSDLP